MAKHMVKCLYCGQMFDANIEPFVKPNARRYAHVACARTEEENQTQEEKDKRELEEYIKELFGVSTIPVKIRKQMDTFRKEKNYKKADEIRNRLLSMGIEIMDTPQGVKWKRK